MKLLTASLEKKALDWALAKALGRKPHIKKNYIEATSHSHRVVFRHTNPALCLGRMKADSILVMPNLSPTDGKAWVAAVKGKLFVFGDTPEQAVARCVVQMRLGDEVDVPDELCGEQA